MRTFAPCLLVGLRFWTAPVPVLSLPATVLRSPNELGSIMILEYHRIAEPDGRWTSSPAHLREDLERLWDAGYRSIALAALITGSIDLPLGTSPVVLTFDDSSPAQFQISWSFCGCGRADGSTTRQSAPSRATYVRALSNAARSDTSTQITFGRSASTR